MTHHTDAERAEFEAWLGIKPCGAAHDFAWEAWKAARRAPEAPVPQGWIDPNDKAQKQYLPHIGERVLFKHDGCVYLGKHTGGSFKAEYPLGKTFGTWDCKWMYPSVLDAAAPQPPEAAPVQLPEPAAWVFKDRTWTEIRAMAVDHGGVPAYTEQQVREILKAHGITVKKSEGG